MDIFHYLYDIFHVFYDFAYRKSKLSAFDSFLKKMIAFEEN